MKPFSYRYGDNGCRFIIEICIIFETMGPLLFDIEVKLPTVDFIS